MQYIQNLPFILSSTIKRKVGSVCGALLPFGSRFPQTCLRTVRTCSHVYGSPLITLIYLP